MIRSPKATAIDLCDAGGVLLLLLWSDKAENVVERVDYSDGEQYKEKTERAEKETVTSTVLPFPLDLNTSISFAWHWLTTSADYGNEPDHDGDNGKGWRVYNENWGRVGSFYGFVAIKPAWAMYGK